MSVMSMEFWWNDSDRIKPKYSDVNMSQCHLAHQKFLLYWLGMTEA